MGYYIDRLPDGKALPAKYKAEALIAYGNATKTDGKKFEKNLVCVVQNGPFDAALYVYDEREYQMAKRPDGRPKTWLIVPDAAVFSDFKK